MKAVYILEQGGVDKLIYGELPEPEVGGNEVKVRVRATALNHLDIWARSGLRGVRVDFPHILGCDIAGEVVEVGRNVSRFKPGDRVLFNSGVTCGRCEYCLSGEDNLCPERKSLGVGLDGGYAEYAKASEENAHKIPDSMSFDEAAAIPLVFMTAWHCLITRAGLKPGEDVLIMAAGSGVGSAAIQIARRFGARVIVTASTDEKLLRAKELGADEGINYSQGDFSKRVLELTDGKGVNVILDHVGASVWEQNFACLKRGGRLVNCGVTSGYRVELHMGQLFTRNLSILGSGGVGTKGELLEIMKLVHKGELHGVVARAFPLVEAAEAHRTMESRSFFGKLILNP